MGNLLTRNEVMRIGLKSHGVSTLGGRKVWFDRDIFRIDFDGHGDYVGEFEADEQILVINSSGEYYTTDVDPNHHFDENVIRLEKFIPDKVWSAVLFDASQKGYLYIKRFCFEQSLKRNSFIGDDKNSRLALLTDTVYPRVRLVFGEGDSFREPMEIDVDEFIAVKGFKARGRRATMWNVASVEELEPLRVPEADTDDGNADMADSNDKEDKDSEDDGQMSLF